MQNRTCASFNGGDENASTRQIFGNPLFKRNVTHEALKAAQAGGHQFEAHQGIVRHAAHLRRCLLWRCAKKVGDGLATKRLSKAGAAGELVQLLLVEQQKHIHHLSDSQRHRYG